MFQIYTLLIKFKQSLIIIEFYNGIKTPHTKKRNYHLTKTIKDILYFYITVLICLLISSYGIYLINSIVGIYSIGTILFIIPILTISTILYTLKKANQ